MRLFMLEALVKQQVTKESILTNLQLKKILKDEGVVFAALFGSFVRGEEEEHSDIDLIVRFAEQKTLFQLIRMSQILSDLFGRKVDLLTESSVSPYIYKIIEKEMETIYAA